MKNGEKPMTVAFGHARNIGGKCGVLEGVVRHEMRVFDNSDKRCACEINPSSMCFMCTGPLHNMILDHTDGDL